MVRVAAAVLGLAAAGEALAAAGWVDFAAGGATITDARGRSRAAAKGDDVDPGDTLRTGVGGRVQIHFTDGAYVSLQPGSEFAVKDYNFEGRTDGSERGFFSLARGAMRAVTGLIGRVNRNRYQIATPTATIGIRGTGIYIEAEASRTYACTCYGEAELASRDDPSAREVVRTKHHESPRYVMAGGAPQMLMQAPVQNHTDAELTMLESLVGRRPPFTPDQKY